MSADARRPVAAAAARVGVVARRLAATLRLWSPSSAQPLPRVTVDLGPWVPAWLVRAGVVAAATGCVALAATGGLSWVALLALVPLVLTRPDGPAVGGFVLAVGAVRVLTATEPFSGALFGLVAGLHLVVVLSALTVALPWAARVEVAALAEPAGRFLGVQAVAQPLALLGAWAAGGAATVRWLPVVAVAVLGALGWWLRVRVLDPPWRAG